MRQVFKHIEERSKQFDQRPLFLFLKNQDISARQRLEFIPWVSHFVMTFADLYHFFLTEEPAQDRYQELVNQHLSEEGTHWKWFLSDLTALGLDPNMRFTDAVRLLWSDATVKTRLLAYRVCKLSGGMTSLEKLVLVHAIEATGRVSLEAAVPVGNEVGRSLPRNLVYFGGHHLDTERQHTVEQDDVHESLMSIEIDEQTERRMFQIVDEVFDSFADFVDEAFERASQRTPFSPQPRSATATA
ncbi:MAG: hypothetical protein QM756_27005 [Polyangiaceae bacterium]